MTKKWHAFIFILGLNLTVTGQVNPNAIGIRGSAIGLGFGAELSYQRKVSKNSRVEIDFGVINGQNYSHIAMTGIYHWIKGITRRFSWYIGPGVQFISFSYSDGFGTDETGFLVGIGGQLGLEYDFKVIPLLMSMDIRPMFSFRDEIGINPGGNLALRYTF